jgi:hypothetical protein
MGHGRRCCRPSCRRCGRSRWSAPSMALGGRADARRQHRDTNQKSRKANATRKHDWSSQLVTAHNFQRTGGGIVRCWPRPALRSSAAGSLKRNHASRRSRSSSTTGGASRCEVLRTCIERRTTVSHERCPHGLASCCSALTRAWSRMNPERTLSSASDADCLPFHLAWFLAFGGPGSGSIWSICLKVLQASCVFFDCDAAISSLVVS